MAFFFDREAWLRTVDLHLGPQTVPITNFAIFDYLQSLGVSLNQLDMLDKVQGGSDQVVCFVFKEEADHVSFIDEHEGDQDAFIENRNLKVRFANGSLTRRWVLLRGLPPYVDLKMVRHVMSQYGNVNDVKWQTHFSDKDKPVIKTANLKVDIVLKDSIPSFVKIGGKQVGCN